MGISVRLQPPELWVSLWVSEFQLPADTHTMPLTDIEVRNAKPTEKPRKLFDGGGLYLFVDPKGSKLWRLAYRYKGKERTLSFGRYPTVSLREARSKAEEAKALLKQDIDPSQQRRLKKLARVDGSAATFDRVAQDYIEKLKREDRAPTTLSKVTWLLGLASAGIGNRPVSEIKPAKVLAVLKEAEKRGKLETAKRLRATIGAVFRFAIATSRAEADPTGALRGALAAPKVQHRAAITNPTEFGALLRAIHGFNGQPTTITALLLLAYLFPRPGELRMAEWSEFDLEAAVWSIPASRTKMRRPHKVPLPRQALGLLTQLRAITDDGQLVFPGYGVTGGEGRKRQRKPISENTLNGALRRLGYAKDEVTAHGFRATASTILNESGLFSADAIERALAHQDPDAVRRAYARGEFWEERVRMAQWWADHLDRLKATP